MRKFAENVRFFSRSDRAAFAEIRENRRLMGLFAV